MNRLVLVSEDTISTSSHAENDHLHELITSRRPGAAKELDLPYATFAPIHYEERYAYPLVVWLHDSAGNEQELRQVMPLVSMRNYVAIAPRGTCDAGSGRYDWRQTSDAIESAHSRIVECIATAKERFNIHNDRVFLVGRGAG